MTYKNASTDGVKIRKLHDGQGLYLWVYEDGRKYWRLRYYKIHNKKKSISLGVCPVGGRLGALLIRYSRYADSRWLDSAF